MALKEMKLNEELYSAVKWLYIWLPICLVALFFTVLQRPLLNPPTPSPAAATWTQEPTGHDPRHAMLPPTSHFPSHFDKQALPHLHNLTPQPLYSQPSAPPRPAETSSRDKSRMHTHTAPPDCPHRVPQTPCHPSQGPGIPHPFTNLTPSAAFNGGSSPSPFASSAVASLHLHTVPGPLHTQTTSANEPP